MNKQSSTTVTVEALTDLIERDGFPPTIAETWKNNTSTSWNPAILALRRKSAERERLRLQRSGTTNLIVSLNIFAFMYVFDVFSGFSSGASHHDKLQFALCLVGGVVMFMLAVRCFYIRHMEIWYPPVNTLQRFSDDLSRFGAWSGLGKPILEVGTRQWPEIARTIMIEAAKQKMLIEREAPGPEASMENRNLHTVELGNAAKALNDRWVTLREFGLLDKTQQSYYDAATEQLAAQKKKDNKGKIPAPAAKQIGTDAAG